MRVPISWLVVLSLSSGCHSSPGVDTRAALQPHSGWDAPEKPSTAHVKASPLPKSALIAMSHYSDTLHDHPGRRVVRDSVAWREVWTQAHPASSAPPPLPSVDFKNEMVLAATAGPVMQPGRILLDSVGTERGHLVAVVTIERRCSPAAFGEAPTIFVRVPATSKPVRFVERVREYTQCE